MKTLNIFPAVLIAFMVVIAVASCKKPTATYEDFTPATVLVFNAYPVSAVTSVNLFMNNQKLTVTPLTYATSLANMVVVAGDKTAQFINSNTAQDVLANGAVTFAPGTVNTIFLTGIAGTGDIVTTVDDLTPAPAGKAKIRTVHLSPNLPAADFLIQGGLVLSKAQAYKTATDFAVIDTGTYVFQVKDAQTTAVKGSTAKIKLVSTQCYTFLARGLVSGTPALTLQLFNNVKPY